MASKNKKSSRLGLFEKKQVDALLAKRKASAQMPEPGDYAGDYGPAYEDPIEDYEYGKPSEVCESFYHFCITCETGSYGVGDDIEVGNPTILDEDVPEVDYMSDELLQIQQDLERECRNRGGQSEYHFAVHACGDPPSSPIDDFLLHSPFRSEVMDFCNQKGSCCIGIDFQDGCDPTYAGCLDNKTRSQCSAIQDIYGRGVVTSFQQDEECNVRVEPEPGGLITQPFTYTNCFDDPPNNSYPENFSGSCCIPGNPMPQDRYDDETLSECNCRKRGGRYYEYYDFPYDACDNQVCPESLESQNKMVDCCVKFDNNTSSCVRILRCQCNEEYLSPNGVNSASVMPDGCRDKGSGCNCC